MSEEPGGAGLAAEAAESGARGAPPGPGLGGRRVELAGWGRRAVGYIIDVGGVVVLAHLAAQVVPGAEGLLELLGGYLVLPWLFATGRSPAARLLGLRLVAEGTGEPVSVSRAVARMIAHSLDAVLLIGFCWPLWDRRRQTFADKLLGTVVLRE